MSEQEQPIILKTNLEKLPTLSYSVPVSYRFPRCQPQEADSWRGLYGGVLRHLCQNYYPQVCAALPDNEIGDLKASGKMKAPCWIRRGVYAETGLSPDVLLRRMRAVLIACDLKPSALYIEYTVDEERKRAAAEAREKAYSEPWVLHLDWEHIGPYTGSIPVSYRYKSQRAVGVSTWGQLYIAVISTLAQEYPRVMKSGVSLDGGKTIGLWETGKPRNPLAHPRPIREKLCAEELQSASKVIDSLDFALTLCGVERSALDIRFTFPDVERCLAYSGKKKESGVRPDAQIIKRIRRLLEEHFEDGYRIASGIDRGRLLTFYEERYHEPLPLGPEELGAALQSIARPVDGKIRMRVQEKMEALCGEIMARIDGAFEAGATCVYSSVFLTLFRGELAECGVGDERTFREMLSDSFGNRYKLRGSLICRGRREPDTAAELRNWFLDQGGLAAAEDLAIPFWYVPQAVLWRELRKMEELIYVGDNVWFYAPYLPISAEEGKQIRADLKEFFSQRQQMKELELLDIVLRTCPRLLSEVSQLTWNALKESLGYVFRDVISIAPFEIKPAG